MEGNQDGADLSFIAFSSFVMLLMLRDTRSNQGDPVELYRSSRSSPERHPTIPIGTSRPWIRPDRTQVLCRGGIVDG
jgi:hypothetical protein